MIKSFTDEQRKDLDNRLSALYKILVPSSGKADTVHGEIIRAVSRIDYRAYNDGEVFWMDVQNCACGEAAAYLEKTLPERYQALLHHVVAQRIDEFCPKYENFLSQLKEITLDVIATTENKPNTVDMWNIEPIHAYTKCDECDDIVLEEEIQSDGMGNGLCECCDDSDW